MSELPQKRSRWTCPECGLVNRGVHRCTSCNYQRESSEQQDSPALSSQNNQGTSLAKISSSAQLSFCHLCEQTALRSLGKDDLLWQCDACGQLVWTGKQTGVNPSNFRKLTKTSSEKSARIKQAFAKDDQQKQTKRFLHFAGYFLGLAVMGLISAIVIYTLLEIKNNRKKPPSNQAAELVFNDELARQAPWAKVASSRNRVRDFAFEYAKSTQANQLSSLVLNAKELKPQIEQWLESRDAPQSTNSEFAPQASLKLINAKLIEGQWWRLTITGENLNGSPLEREVVIEITEQDLRIDWEASEGIGELSWEDFLAQNEPSSAQQMRVFIEPARPASNSMIPLVAKELNAYAMWIYPQGEENATAVSYVPKNSELALALEQAGLELDHYDAQGNILSLGEPKRLTLLLELPKKEEITENQKLEGVPMVNIKQVLRDSWLSFSSSLNK